MCWSSTTKSFVVTPVNIVTLLLVLLDKTGSIVNDPVGLDDINLFKWETTTTTTTNLNHGMIIDIIRNGGHSHCSQALPVHSNYTPLGRQFQLNDLPIYETRGQSQILLIDIYDIFGFHKNTLQVADRLAHDGRFKIVIPDFFRRSAFTLDNFPPKDPNQLTQFIQTRGNWEKTVRKDVLNVIDFYKKKGMTGFGMLGFCWGGRIALRAAIEIVEIKAVALVHPSWDTNTLVDVNTIHAPLFLIPSKDEPELIYLYVQLQRKFGMRCGHRRFYDMSHGFCGARGNFDDPRNMERVEEVISLLKEFFDKNLRQQPAYYGQS